MNICSQENLTWAWLLKSWASLCSEKKSFYFEYLATFAEIGLTCKLEHFKIFFLWLLRLWGACFSKASSKSLKINWLGSGEPAFSL